MDKKEMSVTLKRAEDILSWKKDGVVIVLESKEEDDSTSLSGSALVHNLSRIGAIQAVLKALNVNGEIVPMRVGDSIEI